MFHALRLNYIDDVFALNIVPIILTPNYNIVYRVLVSINEINELQGLLTSQGYDVIHAGGAGYKILSVILGLADLYVTTKCQCHKTVFFLDNRCCRDARMVVCPDVCREIG